MFFEVKLLHIKIFFEIITLTTQLSHMEKLIRQDKMNQSLLFVRLSNQNKNLFSNSFGHEVKYFEKEIYDKKLKIELTLRLLEKSLANNVTENFLNDIHANYLNYIFQTNENRRFRTLIRRKNVRHKRFVSHSLLSLDSNNELEKFFTLKNQKVEEDILLDEIIEEMSRKNFKENSELFKSLSEPLKTFSRSRKNKSKVCPKGFYYNNECHDVNECGLIGGNRNQTLSNCDPNAACINTLGSFKCKCNKGFIGDGTMGNCFNGKFCSGRFCRQNGECFHKNSRNGYKCRCMLDCLNGGTCIMTKYKYECKCPKSSTGLLCNETVQDDIEKMRSNNRFESYNLLDKLILNKLIHFVPPNPHENSLIKFKMLNMFESYLNKRSKQSEIPNISGFYLGNKMLM
jgi:hypothetical protein